MKRCQTKPEIGGMSPLFYLALNGLQQTAGLMSGLFTTFLLLQNGK